MGARSLISARWYGATYRPKRYVAPVSEMITWTPVYGPSVFDRMLKDIAIAELTFNTLKIPLQEYLDANGDRYIIVDGKRRYLAPLQDATIIVPTRK